MPQKAILILLAPLALFATGCAQGDEQTTGAA